MNTPPDDDFSELRTLLSLKRHEQPPPGYFNNFSRDVIASLKAEQAGSFRATETGDAPGWIVRFLESLQVRPGLSGAVGAGFCALLVGGVLMSEGDAQAPATIPSLLSQVTSGGQPAADVTSTAMAFQPVTAETSAPLLVASNNLPMSSRPSLFDTPVYFETAPAAYRPTR